MPTDLRLHSYSFLFAASPPLIAFFASPLSCCEHGFECKHRGEQRERIAELLFVRIAQTSTTESQVQKHLQGFKMSIVDRKATRDRPKKIGTVL
jgi:hypothetical protein